MAKESAVAHRHNKKPSKIVTLGRGQRNRRTALMNFNRASLSHKGLYRKVTKKKKKTLNLL